MRTFCQCGNEVRISDGIVILQRSTLFREAERSLFSPAHLESTQADVAQLVEQPIRNRQVSGSSPLVGSIPFELITTR